MRATLSLLQAWILGIGVFIAMSAAFCVALIVAIAGPPTDEEMRGMRAASNAALRSLTDALDQAGEDLCARFPQTAGADQFCPAETAEASPPPTPAPVDIAPPASTPAPESSPQAQPIDTAPDLLGSSVETVPTAALAPRHRQITRSRHTAHRVRPTRPHAPAVHRMARIEPHAVTAPVAPAAVDAPALIDVRPTTANVIQLPAPAPSQDEAPPKLEAPNGPRQEQAPSMAL